MEYKFESLGPTLRIVALVFMLGFAVALLGLLIVLAALPGYIARRRHHTQSDAINICGWLGLPTGILWVVAMVWAYVRDQSAAATVGVSGTDVRLLVDQIVGLEQAVTALESKKDSSK